MKQLRKCPVCGSDAKKVIKHVHLVYPEGYLLPVDFDIVSCVDCGAVYHNVEASSNYTKFYNTYTGKNGNYSVSTDDERLNEYSVRFIESQFLDQKDAQILDIGCSYGILLGKLKQRGYRNLTGMDLDVSAVDYVGQMGISAVYGGINDLREEFTGKFDLIILRHIIEHIYHPKQAIENVSKWLKPQGAICIEIPCLSLYYETAPFPGYFIENQHINHFTLTVLDNLMCNFSLVASESKPELYPLLKTIYQKDTYERKLIRDDNAAEYVSRMINCSNAHGERLNKKLEQLDGKPLALWGVSSHVYRLLSHTALKDMNIVCLVDKNPDIQGMRVMGISIESPSSLHQFKGTIVVSGKASRRAILEDIQKLGLRNEVVCLCDE